MTGQAPQLSFREVLKILPIRRLWQAQIVSIFGDFLAIFAVISIVTFEMHGTATQISAILVSYLVPFAFISPIAGVFADRWNVKHTMVVSDLIRALLVLVLIFVRDLYAIYAIFFAISTVSTFFMPSQSIAIRTIVPPNGLMSSNALMMQAMQGAQIISPAVAGLMVQLLGANSCFIFDSGSFFFSAFMISRIAIQREQAMHQNAASVFASMREGFRFILTHGPIAMVMLAMTAGMFAIRCFGVLLSVWVRDILGSTTAVFGTLNSLIGIGMVVGSLFLRKFAEKSPRQHLIVYGLGGMGCAVLITAVFSLLATTAIGMLTMGFFAAFIWVSCQTLMQQETPRDMLGRVSSSMMSLMAVSQVAAMVAAGPVAQQIGIRNLYFASAALLAVITGLGMRKLRTSQLHSVTAAR